MPVARSLHSLAKLVTYDAFRFAEQLLTQPPQLVAGSEAGSLGHSEEAFRRAASTHKNLHVVDGAGHVGLYDLPQFVAQAMGKLVPFFSAKLSRQAPTQA